LWAGASSFTGMALTSAVARQYLDREGLHLRVGKVETYPWDQLAGAERTRAGNYPRLQITLRSDDDEPRTVDVDTFRASGIPSLTEEDRHSVVCQCSPAMITTD
jgi:hypothetical protein